MRGLHEPSKLVLPCNKAFILTRRVCILVLLISLASICAEAQLVISPSGTIQAVIGQNLRLNCTSTSPQINADTIHWNLHVTDRIKQDRVALSTWQLSINQYATSDGTELECLARTFNGSSVLSSVLLQPVSSCTGQSLFSCSSGECLSASQKCDGVAQCRDLSDEKSCAVGVVPAHTAAESASLVTASSTTTISNKMSDASVIGLVVGIVLGIVALIIITVVIVVLLRRKRQPLNSKTYQLLCLRLCETTQSKKPSGKSNVEPVQPQNVSKDSGAVQPKQPSKEKGRNGRPKARSRSAVPRDKKQPYHQPRLHPQSYPPYNANWQHQYQYQYNQQYQYPYAYHYPHASAYPNAWQGQGHYAVPQNTTVAPKIAAKTQEHVYENWPPNKTDAPLTAPTLQPQTTQNSFAFPPYFALQNALYPPRNGVSQNRRGAVAAQRAPVHQGRSKAFPGAHVMRAEDEVVTMRSKRRSHSPDKSRASGKHHPSGGDNRMRIESHIKSITNEQAFIPAAAPFTHFDDVSPRRRIAPSSVNSRVSRLSSASRCSRPAEWGFYHPMMSDIEINNADSVFNVHESDSQTSEILLSEEDRAVQADLDEHARTVHKQHQDFIRQESGSQNLLSTVGERSEDLDDDTLSHHTYVNVHDVAIGVEDNSTLHVDVTNDSSGVQPPTSGSPLPPYSSQDPITLPHDDLSPPVHSFSPPDHLYTGRPLLVPVQNKLNEQDIPQSRSATHSANDTLNDGRSQFAYSAPQPPRGNSFRFFESAM